MDYKKKYKDALAWVESIYPELNHEHQMEVEAFFPELKESEDEKIRKSLKILLQHFCNGYRVPGLDFPVSYKDMLAWLEKQGTSYTKRDVDDAYVEGMAFAKDELEKQKPAWSRGDDVMVHDILGWLPVKSRPEYNQRRADWLKSLKGRVQPKQEWSEEDENCLSTIIAEFSKCAGKSVSKDEWMRCNDFLNSLRDRVYPSCHMDSKMLRKS